MQTATLIPTCFEAPVIGIAAALGDHDSGLHQHQRGQLLYTREGCRASRWRSNCVCCLLRARHGFPPHHSSRSDAAQRDYRSIYLNADYARPPTQVCVIEVSSLLRAVLEPMAMADFALIGNGANSSTCWRLSLNEIRDATHQPTLLPLQKDKAPGVPRWQHPSACHRNCNS